MEKRTLKRIPVSLEAGILLNNHSYAAHIINLSENGLHMIVSPGKTTVELEPGAEHTLAVTVPSGDTFHLRCRVRWSSAFLHYRLTKIVGLMIIDPPPEYKTFFRTTLYEVRNDISHSPIAVIGMAGYYPGAPDLKRFWENILARRREFRQIPEQRLPLAEYYDPDPSVPDKTYANRAAVIDGFEFDWIKRGIPKTVVESTDIAHWLALEVALKALADAGYTKKNVPLDRAGVVLGNTLTGEHSRSENMRLRWPYVRKTLKAAAVQKGMSPKQIAELTETMEEFYKSVFSPVTEDTLAGNLSNTIAGRICNFLNLNGGGYTVDGACSSSLIAVATGATALSNGKLDIALTGGVDISLDTFELIGFAKTNALTRDDMRVYDRKANGFIPGEGSGFVVLKRLADARADGDRIYAVLRGWGISSDGKGSMTAPKAKNQALAIRRAYTQAGYSLQDIDFIEGHGTGTPAGDKAELEGIAQAMNGGSNGSLRPCGITSLKSIIGHTKAASGIGGFIKTAIAVNRRVLPPTAGCEEPNPVFATTAHAVYPILQGAIRSPDDTIRAGVSGMGFGGINCHVTLESGDAPAKNLEPSISEKALLVSRQNTELFALSAGSQPRLLERVQHLTNVVQGISIGDMVDLANHLACGVSDQAPWRAALIAATPQELFDSLKRMEKILIEETTPQGKLSCNTQQTLWLGNSVQQHRIGFLFPGQGSQRLNMGRTMVERYSWARDLVDQADTWLANAGFESLSSLIYRPLDRALNEDQKTEWTDLLTRTQTAQPAICLTSLLWVRYLDLLGIKPVVAGGHSLGELTAFYMAGALSEKDLLCFAAYRGMVMAADIKDAGMMAGFACNRERVEDILHQIDGYAVIANINSPTQTVLSGEKSAVERAMQLAAAMDITSRRLPVANAFHSRFVFGAADLLRREAQLPKTLEHLDIKLLSCMEGAEITPGIDLRDHFAQQIVSKVDFVALVNKMAQECDLMVEVGPGRVLTNLTRSCLDREDVCFSVEARTNDDRSLNTFLGCYFVCNGDINWPALYENRLVRPFTPPGERLFLDNPRERPLAVMPAETRQFPSAVDEPVVSLLAAAADVSPNTISNYISRRGRFLGSLIKADLDDSYSQHAPEILPRPEEYIQDQPADFIEEQNESKTKSDPAGHDLPVADLLLELIEKRTGFPKQSLSLDLRLLDDLNLDSIKAGDLLAEIAVQLKVAGEFDVSQYANATLREITDAFDGLGAGNRADRGPDSFRETARDAEAVLAVVLQGAAQLTGRAVDNVKAEALLGSDLNLSVEQCGELVQHIGHALGTELNVDLPPLLDCSLAQVADIVKRILRHRQARQSPPPLIAHRPWVREIHAQLIETPDQPHEESRRYEDNWKHARVLLLNSESSLVDSLENHLMSLGAEVVARKLDNDFQPDAVAKDASFSHLIVTLPQESETITEREIQLEEIITRLGSIAAPPHAAKAPRRRTTVAYIQFGGGRFGMEPGAGYLNNCCASALAKSLHLERDDLRVRVLDFDPALPALTIAEKIAVELHMVEDFAAVGYDRDLNRRELKLRLLSPADYQDRPFSWSKEDVILVTGGAKGITAACALGVSRATGARMAMLGRSPHPDDQPESKENLEIASTLKKYAEAGLTAQYYCCDVSDRDSVRKVVRQIQESMGPITGVIHGAGLNVPRLINQVSVQEALHEVSPKILGIINLMAELQDAPPRLFVGLSSIIGVIGIQGNAWYGFSNEALDVILNRIEADHPQTKTLSVAYSVWKEDGMAARMGSVSRLKQIGIDSIPTKEGVKRFVRLFVKDPGVHQVIITSRLIGLDTWQWQEHIPEPQGRFLEEPLHVTPGVESVFQAHLSLEIDLYLKDHVFNGSYLFPTVFGLEAMAQAVAHVTRKYDFSRVRIENIQLKRPITVDPETGADIVVWAELAEPESSSPLQTVHAGVYKQGAGQSLDYFSATFVLGLAEESPKYDIDLPEAPLDIQPRVDLYDGKLLFQGPRFQRLQHIYTLDSQKSIFASKFHASNPDSNGEQWLLGDPFFRDSLLHSTQLPVSQHICLPISIESIERYPTKAEMSGSLPGVTVIDHRTEEEVYGSVVTTDENGQVIERLNGYVLKIMEHHPEYPTPEEIAAPDHRDELIIRDELTRRAALLSMNIPAISVTYISGLKKLTKKKRRIQELPILQKAVKQAISKNKRKINDINITWLASGKPVLKNKNLCGWNLSLSHDRETVLCIVGKGPQGCDIESLTSRTRKEWIALLNNQRIELLDELINHGDVMDRAGTRIWAAMESLTKATDAGYADFQIQKLQGESVLFKTNGPEKEHFFILTFPVTLTRGPQRMLAISCQPVAAAAHLPETNRKGTQEITTKDYENTGPMFGIDIDEGFGGQRIYVQRFPLNFKETQGASGGVYFTNYFDWFGKLREAALTPIMAALCESFETGRWGLVTKNVELKIYSDARVDDRVESRLWLKDLTGKYNSNISLGCEWYRITDAGETVHMARGDMMTGWVEIKPHGIINMASLPGFFDEFIHTIYTRTDSNPKDNPVESHQENFEYGAELYNARNGTFITLGTEKFQTSQEHSTPLRNIYFSNFAKWQGQTLERWLYGLLPSLIKNQGPKGELKYIKTRVNYLREAMVFDEIHVTMYLKSIHQNGFKVLFDFNRIENGKKEKLASSELEAVWVVRSEDKTMHSTRMPIDLRELFLKQVPKSAVPQMKINRTNSTRHQKQFTHLVDEYQRKMQHFRLLCKDDPHKEGTEERHQIFLDYFNTVSRELELLQANIDRVTLAKMRRSFQKVVLEYLDSSKIVRHSLEKPFGYTGDFQLLDMLIKNDITSKGLGYHFDRTQLENPSSIACRNRVEWVANEIIQFHLCHPDRKIQILDLGIGAAPIEKRLVELKSDIELDILAVDIEPLALSFVQRILADDRRTVTPLNLNLRKQESLKHIAALAGNLDYCIAIGILEALTEKETIELLKVLLSSMPKGAIIYTEKYLPTHPARTSMEWFMDFFLSYSSFQDMKNLALEAGAHPDRTEAVEDPSGSIVTLKLIV